MGHSGNDVLCNVVGYTQQFVDLSVYAGGGVHTIEFRTEIFGSGGVTNFFVDNVSLLDEEPPTLARFPVTKEFNDNSEAEVEVTLSCNTDLPLEQTTTISNSPLHKLTF